MQINADFSQRASVHGAQIPWTASPMAGVDRQMLDRLGDEVARATSIVRYAPGSAFSSHVHTGGEEFLVLDGVFQDEHGDFPEGSYIRNPPGTSHTPRSAPGCVILVKLWQFDPADRTQVRIDTNERPYDPDQARAGAEVMPLHTDVHETVRLEKWAPGAQVRLDAADGLEIFVLGGTFTEQGEQFARYSWLRLPRAATSQATAGPDGAKVWMKSGHLSATPVAPDTD